MPKALVVDDSAVVRRRLGSILKDLGYQVVEASDGKEGLSMLAENLDTKLAFVDWNMPNMNGIEFVESVRQDSSYGAMRILMVTTETDMSFVVKAISAGANKYIMKPFTSEMVIEKMKILGVDV